MSQTSSEIAAPFRAGDYARNLALVQGDLAARALRVGVLFDPESIYWLTRYQSIGYFTFQALVVPQSGLPVLVSRRVNEGLALGTPTPGGFRGIEDTLEPVSAPCTAAGDAVRPETGARPDPPRRQDVGASWLADAGPQDDRADSKRHWHGRRSVRTGGCSRAALAWGASAHHPPTPSVCSTPPKRPSVSTATHGSSVARIASDGPYPTRTPRVR
jgi:hypothetical protein